MKKYFFGLIALCCVSNVVFAQDAENKIIDVKVDGSAFAEMGQKIQNVSLDFCDKYGSKSVDYDFSVGKEQDVCFTLFNGSDNDVVVNLGFVDGMATNDQWKNRACGTAENTSKFGQYVTGYQPTLVLKKNETKTAHAKIIYPKDMVFTGSTVEGCLVYSLAADSSDTKDPVGFGVVVRKAKFIALHIKKAPIFDIRYLSLFGICILVGAGLVIYRKKIFSNMGK